MPLSDKTTVQGAAIGESGLFGIALSNREYFELDTANLIKLYNFIGAHLDRSGTTVPPTDPFRGQPHCT